MSGSNFRTLTSFTLPSSEGPAWGLSPHLGYWGPLLVSWWISLHHLPQFLHSLFSLQEGPHLTPISLPPLLWTVWPQVPLPHFWGWVTFPPAFFWSLRFSKPHPILCYRKDLLGRDHYGSSSFAGPHEKQKGPGQSRSLTECPWPWRATASPLLSAQEASQITGSSVPNHHVGWQRVWPVHLP